MRKPSFPPARKIYKVQMYGINRYRAGTARIYACGDSRLRGHRSRKPIGFRQWVVHKSITTHETAMQSLPRTMLFFLPSKSATAPEGISNIMPVAW